MKLKDFSFESENGFYIHPRCEFVVILILSVCLALPMSNFEGGCFKSAMNLAQGDYL